MRGPSYTGRVLGGRYAVGELLGEGGWGAVYAGVQTDLGRKVALKILHNVTNARRTTTYEPHAKLDPCVIAALRTMKWQALPGGGSPRVSLTARTRDNP